MALETIRRALAVSALQAAAICFAVLDDPDSKLYLDREGVPTSDLVATYRRSLAHEQEIGLRTVGLRETVDRLKATPLKTLLVVDVEGAEGDSCVVFVSPDLGDVVAAIAVLGPMSIEGRADA